jgi:hypothetical protein
MLVNESRRRVTAEELGDDTQADVLLAVERLLQDVAAVAVRCKIDDATPFNGSAEAEVHRRRALTSCTR